MVKFNIYYLNFSKLYELYMLSDNTETEEIIQIKQNNIKSINGIGIKSDILGLNHQKEQGEYFQLVEKLKVKHEKSVILNELIPSCENISCITDVTEGTLVLIDNVKIEFYDNEQNQRTYSLFQKRIFEGMNIDGIDINNLFSTIMEGMSYLMKCELNGRKIIFKIPIESKSEFENKYSINDLLIGTLSIIGVYKGKINEEDFKRTTLFNTEMSEDNKNTVDIIESSVKTKTNSLDAKDDNYYIDIFAIIQNINLIEVNNETETTHKSSRLMRLKQFLKGE